MSTLATIRPLSRAAVDLTLRTTRLPLTLAERMTGRENAPDGWAPALYFAGFEALVKRAAGTLLGDEEMRDAGRLLDSAVDHEERARDLETRAEQAEEAVQERTIRRKASAEQAARSRKSAADAAGAARRRQVAKAKDQGDKLLEDEARVRRAVAVEAERRAVAAEGQAVEAEREAARLDEQIDRS